MLLLYHGITSVCSVKVRVGLAEMGLAYDERVLDLQAGDQNDPAYLKLNRDAVVPTLVDDGLVVVESSLILEGANSRISAASSLGVDGTVIRRAPDGQLIDLSQELAPPPLDAKALLAEPCAARRPGGANSLVVQASDGMPVDVSAVLPAFLPSDVFARLGDEDALADEGEVALPDALSLAARIDAATTSPHCLN